MRAIAPVARLRIAMRNLATKEEEGVAMLP